MTTGLEKEWEEFYQSGFYADGWTFRIDPQKTQEEVEAILELLNPPTGAHFLDWCGGWGRHSIELARRSFRVTLLDFTPLHIQLAEEAAGAADVDLDLICADFRETPPGIQADYAVNLFTAGIGHLEEEDDLQALKSLHAALKPGALFLIDTLNLFWLASHYQPKGWDEDDSGEKRLLEKREFDFLTNRNHALTILWERRVEERQQELDLRVYSPAELAAVLRRAEFEPERLYGDLDGREFGFDSKRIIMVSRRD